MIVFEGAIGAGKTTAVEVARVVLHELAPDIKIFVYEEPVDANPYLVKFYKDMARWGLEMQYFLMAYRFRMHEGAIRREWNDGAVTIFDRSIYGDAAFAYLLHDDGLIDDDGYDAYLLHRECMERFLLAPQMVIFLDSPVDTLMGRIERRGRECEKGLPRLYQARLVSAYKKVVLPELAKRTEVLTLDWADGDHESGRMRTILKQNIGRLLHHQGLKEVQFV